VKHFAQLTREFPEIELSHTVVTECEGHSLNLQLFVGKLAEGHYIVRANLYLDGEFTQVIDFHCPELIAMMECVSYIVHHTEAQFIDYYKNRSGIDPAGYWTIN
jgi:hypothetical protein